MGDITRVSVTKHWKRERPTHCQLCGDKLEGHFVDGRTVNGVWGLFCLSCNAECGRGVGTGLGQLYNLTTLEKVAG